MSAPPDEPVYRSSALIKNQRHLRTPSRGRGRAARKDQSESEYGPDVRTMASTSTARRLLVLDLSRTSHDGSLARFFEQKWRPGLDTLTGRGARLTAPYRVPRYCPRTWTPTREPHAHATGVQRSDAGARHCTARLSRLPHRGFHRPSARTTFGDSRSAGSCDGWHKFWHK